jgi:hypothetical protein
MGLDRHFGSGITSWTAIMSKGFMSSAINSWSCLLLFLAPLEPSFSIFQVSISKLSPLFSATSLLINSSLAANFSSFRLYSYSINGGIDNYDKVNYLTMTAEITSKTVMLILSSDPV